MDKVMPRFQATVDKLSSMLTSPNNATSISRTPPYDSDRQYRSSRLISVASLTVLLLLSIPSLVLKAYSYGFIESNIEMGFYLVNDEVQGEPEGQNLVAALPLSLFRVPEKLVLIVAMLNILLTMAHLAFVAWDWRAGRRTRTRAFRRNIMILHIVNLVLVLTALIAVFDSHKASSSFKSENIPRTPNAVSPSGYKYFLYDSGTFDLETWTCQLQSARGVGEAREDYRKQCDIEVAGRTMMVPFFVFAFIVAGTSIWSFVIGGKQSSRNEHLWTKDADPEFGKGDADGKQVQVEEVELATLERPDRQKNGRLSKIEEDEQEVEEAPKGATTVSTKVIDEDGEARTTEGSESVTKKTDAA